MFVDRRAAPGVYDVDSPLHADPVLQKIAQKHNVSTAPVLLSYLVARGIVILPKSVTPSRIESNLKLIPLDKEDVDALNGLAKDGKQQRVNAPAWGTDHASPVSKSASVFTDICSRASPTGTARETRTPPRAPASSLARRSKIRRHTMHQ